MNPRKRGIGLILVVLLMVGCHRSIKNELQVTTEDLKAEQEFQIRMEEKESFHVIYSSHGLTVLPYQGNILLVDEEGGRSFKVNLGEGLIEEEKSPPQGEREDEERIKDIEELGLTLGSSDILSEDKSRLAFLNRDAGIVQVYNRGNGKRITIPLDDFSLDKEEGIEVLFSPKGTYATVMGVNDEGYSGFQSFSSHDGRKIHLFIQGGRPLWSNNEKYIAFLEVKENAKQGERIGIYTVSSKNITYIQGLEEGDHIEDPGQWVGEDTSLLFTSQRRGRQSQNLHLYTLKDKVLRTIEEDGDGLPIQTLVIENPAFRSNKLMYSLMNQEGDLISFKVYDLEGKGAEVYDNTSPFLYGHRGKLGQVNYILLGEETLLYVQENYVYTSAKGNSKCILKERGRLERIQMLEKNEILVFYIEGKEEKQIVFYPLKNIL